MRRRILLWALAGLLVSFGWTAYAFFTAPDIEVQLSIVDRGIQALAYLTCPIIATGVRYYWVAPANAVSYALLGLLWESIRRKSK